MRLVLGLLFGAAALAPGLAGAQIEQRTQEDLAVDGSVRVRTRDTPRPERGEQRPDRRRDGDGVRAARPDRVTERPSAQLFPPRLDRHARKDRRDDRSDH